MILLVFAFVCFVLAAVPYPQPNHPYGGHLVAAGLAFYTAHALFPGI